jgi:hypoxanthine phosphoribosyltransferase
MKIKDRDFEVYITEVELAAAVGRLAGRIDADYAGRRPLLCPVLTGSFMFASDLVRRLKVECEVEFVKYTSYEGMQTTGRVQGELPFPTKVKGRDVIVVEDVVDTGVSMGEMLRVLKTLGPRSVRVCTLLMKPECFRGGFEVDYVGMEIGEDFIVGYGMDYDGEGRGLKEIYKVKR